MVKKPTKGAVVEGLCAETKGGRGKHDLIVVENPANTDTYIGKCRRCGRRVVRKND